MALIVLKQELKFAEEFGIGNHLDATLPTVSNDLWYMHKLCHWNWMCVSVGLLL